MVYPSRQYSEIFKEFCCSSLNRKLWNIVIHLALMNSFGDHPVAVIPCQTSSSVVKRPSTAISTLDRALNKSNTLLFCCGPKVEQLQVVCVSELTDTAIRVFVMPK